VKDFGYVDPVQRAHEQRTLRNAAQPSWAPQLAQPVASPLAGLAMAEAQVFSNPGAVPQRQSVAESMLLGGFVGGALGLLFARRREARRQRKAQELQAIREHLGIEDVQ
jgi:hypothetical protein